MKKKPKGNKEQTIQNTPSCPAFYTLEDVKKNAEDYFKLQENKWVSIGRSYFLSECSTNGHIIGAVFY